MNSLQQPTQIAVLSDNSNKDSAKLDKGRWKKEEHELFLKGLEIYGRDWKKIESLVGSRTGPQIRSHAQKYFNKITKDKEVCSSSGNTIKIRTSPMSSPQYLETSRWNKDTDTTNPRKVKEANKTSEKSAFGVFESSKKCQYFPNDYDKKLRIPVSNLSSFGMHPLVPEEKQIDLMQDTPKQEKIDACRKESSRMYNEQEVLSLIRHIIREFAQIMNKFGSNQQMALGSAGMLNLNSALLLSLVSSEQAPNGSSLTSPISNIIQQNVGLGNLNNLNHKQNFDIENLLKNQDAKDMSLSVSSENLLQIPKMSNPVGLNMANLQILANLSQSQNSYNTILNLNQKSDVKTHSSLQIKRYDSALGETKDDSDSAPSMEMKADF